MRTTSLVWPAVSKVLGAVCLAASVCSPCIAIEYPGPAPGKAQATVRDGHAALENAVLCMTWRVAQGALQPTSFRDKLEQRGVALDNSDSFVLRLATTPLPGVRVVRASELRVEGAPQVATLPADPKSLRVADQQPGQAIVVHLASVDGQLQVTWRAELRDGSSYVRQRISCGVKHKELELAEVVMWDLALPGAEVCGVVDGSPVVAGNWFFAAEHPMSKSRRLEECSDSRPVRFTCSYQVNGALMPGQAREFCSVVGVTPAGQMRRGFLYYLERERAQPYRPFLHYNNGFEIGHEYWKRMLHGKPGEGEAFRRQEQQIWLEAIETFGRELVVRRQVVMDSFAHDYGWDDENLIWQFHEGYPQGFLPAQQAAAKYHSQVSVWLSPFGGYPCKKYRVESGRNLGYQTTRNNGLTLACPHYAARFREACLGLMELYGVNYFKFDGFGAGNNKLGSLEFVADLEGLLDLAVRLRQQRPDVFINPSTGSWPSPFWLLYVDSVWRQGSDTNVEGKGSARQKWITYRDGQIGVGTLARGPLYPVNSLMIHGVCVSHTPLSGSHYNPATPRPTYDENEITAEIRSYFATGVNLQELYIAHDLMTARTWDVLAEAARWARANAHVLVDTHRFGGDPLAGQVYGWASWSPRKAIISLRNPDERRAEFSLDIGKAFELPAGAPVKYRLKSPWSDEADRPAVDVEAGQPRSIVLEPFQVLVFDAMSMQ